MLFENLSEVFDREPHGAALNMAIDEVLLRTSSVPLLRVYRWARPAVSFGYFEKYAEVNAAPGRELVRRWTGGGVVAHGADVTYSLVVPTSLNFARCPAAESYRAIHACVAEVLRSCGLATSLSAAAAPRVSSGCFENAAAADVLAGERKVAGAAQRRTRWGLLHQGSIQGAELGGEFAARLAPAFARVVDSRELLAAELEAARALAAERYGTDAWTRRF